MREGVSQQSWKAFADLDYENDRSILERWLTSVLKKEPPAGEISAFWFGLFNPVDRKGKVSCCLYIAGSNTFNGNVDDDWPCDPAYFPEGRYSDSKVLSEVYAGLREMHDEAKLLGEYLLCLGYSALVVLDLLSAVDRSLVLGRRKSRAVAVGFDEGDSLFFGSLTRKGWE
jgi:hypothetical protein